MPIPVQNMKRRIPDDKSRSFGRQCRTRGPVHHMKKGMCLQSGSLRTARTFLDPVPNSHMRGRILHCIQNRQRLKNEISWWIETISWWVETIPDSKLRGANLGPTCGLQDPGRPHVGHANLAIWDIITLSTTATHDLPVRGYVFLSFEASKYLHNVQNIQSILYDTHALFWFEKVIYMNQLTNWDRDGIFTH